MASHSNDNEWFELWFNDIYKSIYNHRSQSQAEKQVLALLNKLGNVPTGTVLDVACGGGRHLRALSQTGWRVMGCDLSETLLKDAAGMPVLRCDMRALPFRKNQFELVTSFFSSFGYFSSAKEDLEMLEKMVPVLKPGAFLFLDLPNREHVISRLVPFDEQKKPNLLIRQERYMEGDVVVKDIFLEKNGKSHYFQERLRLYSMDQMKDFINRLNLRLLDVMGDEEGREYTPSTSPRMSLLIRKG